MRTDLHAALPRRRPTVAQTLAAMLAVQSSIWIFPSKYTQTIAALALFGVAAVGVFLTV